MSRGSSGIHTLVGAILPAAGKSRRMGRPKLLLPLCGDTVIGRTATALEKGGAERVLIVGAPEDRALGDWARERDRELAINSDPSRGMLSSVQKGLEALGGPSALGVLLVCPADLPMLLPATVRDLLRERAQHEAQLAVPVHREQRGHPLAIAGDLIGEIAGLDPSIGLRQLLLEHPQELLQVETDDDGAFRDLDTPSDYDRLRSQT